MVDIDTSTRLKDLLDRSQRAIPNIIDEANSTGDYSEVDRATDVMARLKRLSDHHIQMISNAQQEDQAKGIGMPQTAGPSAAGSNLPALDPQGAQDRFPGGLQDRQSWPPGNLKYMSLSPTGYASAMPPMNEANAMPGTETQAPPPASALPDLPQRQEVAGAIDDSIKMLQQRPQPSALPAPQESALPQQGDQASQALDSLLKQGQDYALDRERGKNNAFLNTEASDALDSLIQQGKSNEASQALDSLIQQGSSLPSQGTAITPAALSGIQSEYQNAPLNLPRDIAQDAGMSQYDREFAHRVQMELGQRPEGSTLGKVLMALAQGLGSALGLWVSKKNYEGEAFVDLNKDQRDYDAKKAQIGREVYGAQSRENVAQARGDQGMAKAQLQEGGKDTRQATAIQAKKDELDTAEGGKNSRLATTEGGKNTRQQKALDSRQLLESIRAKTKNVAPQMSIADKAEINRLHLAYSGLDRTLMTVDPKVKAQGDDILNQISEIIKKYQ